MLNVWMNSARRIINYFFTRCYSLRFRLIYLEIISCKRSPWAVLLKFIQLQVVLQLWEPEVIASNVLPWVVLDSDEWNSTSVLLATNDSGVVYVSERISVQVIESAARIMQLVVLESFGLFVARIDKGEEHMFWEWLWMCFFPREMHFFKFIQGKHF